MQFRHPLETRSMEEFGDFTMWFDDVMQFRLGDYFRNWSHVAWIGKWENHSYLAAFDVQ